MVLFDIGFVNEKNKLYLVFMDSCSRGFDGLVQEGVGI